MKEERVNEMDDSAVDEYSKIEELRLWKPIPQGFLSFMILTGRVLWCCYNAPLRLCHRHTSQLPRIIR